MCFFSSVATYTMQKWKWITFNARGVAWDFEDVRTRINFPKRLWRLHLGGSGGMLSQKIFKFRVSEMPSPGFSAGHFQ